MKFTSFVLATLAFASSSVDAAYSPARISFESLQNGNAEATLRQALEEVGMIAITDIPSFDSKVETMKLLPLCMEESSEETVEHTFGDGTRRRTMATHSSGTSASSSLSVANHPICEDFETASQSFRETVGNVVGVFADELSVALNLDASKTLLVDDQDRAFNLRRIFGEGEQLEHFHCYYDSSSPGEQTIEWHTDQGFVLAFTPGLVNGETTEGFYVKLADGSTEMVAFEKTDDLVFLMGDGVNQYLNGALDKPLRALPHALHMPQTSSPRVWYGRMVLPPASAKHPVHPVTFGEIREGMIAEDLASSSIGCSQDLVARELEDTTCEEGVSSYCWHRCMNHTDYVAPSDCEGQGLDHACVNDEGFLWPWIHDPQFKLGCVDLTTAVNWTVTDDSDAGHGGDKNHTDGDDKDDHTDMGEKNHTGMGDKAMEDSSTSTVVLGTSILLVAALTLFSI